MDRTATAGLQSLPRTIGCVRLDEVDGGPVALEFAKAVGHLPGAHGVVEEPAHHGGGQHFLPGADAAGEQVRERFAVDAVALIIPW